jgi:hypothetical protein
VTLYGYDYYNSSTVASAYTPYDSSVISAFTGCHNITGGAVPTVLSANQSFGMFWVDSFASIKTQSVEIPGGIASQFLKADGSIDSDTYLTATALTSLNDKTLYQSTPTTFNTTFNSDIYPLQDNLFNLGFATKRWRYLFCSVSVETPTIDQINYGDTLRIGPANAGAVEIGRANIAVKVSNAYNLPTIAPLVGQVMTCDALGSVSWATQSPSAFATIYPFTTASRTGVLTASSRTYCTTYTITANVLLTQASVFLGSAGSDGTKIGVYRGDLTTATLVGQTTSGAPTSNYYTRALTVVVGQSLTFSVGDQITIVYTTSGGTTTPAYRTTTSNIALATISSNTYTGGLPTTIAGVLTQAATTTRICLELA